MNEQHISTRTLEFTDGISTVQTTFELEEFSLPDESREPTVSLGKTEHKSSANTDDHDQQTAYQVSETMRYVPQIDSRGESRD
jgi:hypothetical protein